MMNSANSGVTAPRMRPCVEPTCQALTVTGRRCTRQVNYAVLSLDGNKVMLLCAAHSKGDIPYRVQLAEEIVDYRAYPPSLLEAIAGLWAEVLRTTTDRQMWRVALAKLSEIDKALDALPMR